MPNTIVYFNQCLKDENKEKLSKIIVEKSSRYLPLPDTVEIEYKKLGHSLYGETLLLVNKTNRFRINDSLNIKEIIFPITHELIHLSQVVEGILTFKKNGVIVWNKREYKVKDPYTLSYEQQQQLPWESDVVKKQQYILSQILK